MKFIRNTIMPQCNSRTEFYSKLLLMGLDISYSKDGIPVGVRDERKVYTWKKLGISPENFRLLDQKQELNKVNQRIKRLEDIEQLRNSKDQNKKRSITR